MLRIAVCQFTLAHYRVPVWDLLGAQPGIDLTVFAPDLEPASMRLPADVHFRLVKAPMQRRRLGPVHLWTHPIHLEVMDPRRFDLVILPWHAHSATVWPAAIKARRAGVPLALWGHGYSKTESWARRTVRDLQGSLGDALVVYTRTVADELVRRGRRADRVFVAQNALDQRPIQEARRWWLDRPDELAAFRERNALDPARTVIFVSRLLRENKARQLIHGLAALKDRAPDIRAVIVGDGEMMDYQRGLAQRLGVADRVTWTGAIYGEMALAPWMLSAALMCYPANIGLSIQHAFGYGLPVVTNSRRHTHNPEIEALDEGVTGLTFTGGQEDGDVGHMVEQWMRILADTALRDRMSRAAHALVTTRYTLENMVQGFLDLCAISDGVRRQVVPLDRPARPEAMPAPKVAAA